MNRYRFRRFWAPTVGLRHAVGLLLLGMILFCGGFSLSFKPFLNPYIFEGAKIWNHFLQNFVPSESLESTNHLLGGIFLLFGFYCLFYGTRSIFRHFFETLNPGLKSKAVNIYVKRQILAHGPRIVAIGGGTGLSTLLRGLKQHSSNITAIVTVTDDGGSSGRLVKEMGMIPPGDLRNCLVALADAEKVMTDLFQHRFKNRHSALNGHSIGNLLLAALVDQYGGDFQQALNSASEVLAIRGRVVPSTLARVQLRAILEDGQEIIGETKIVHSGKKIQRIFLEPANPDPHPEALQMIRDADLICIGPGSVYTSVIPNLLVPEMAQTIRETPASKVYICNVMTQRGETDTFTASEHLAAIQSNVAYRVCDSILVNTGVPTTQTLGKYGESDQYIVEPDIDRIRSMGYKAITGNFISESDYVRHDPLRIASRLIDLLNKGL